MKALIVPLLLLLASPLFSQNDSLRPYNSAKAKELDLKKFPRPILADNPAWVNLYFRALQTVYDKMGNGTPQNGFTKHYIDEGNEQTIDQWDACFSACFGMYLNTWLPAMSALDNFYKKQQKEGFIQGRYRKTDGCCAVPIKKGDPFVEPPLFAWVEWRYYLITGDKSRFARVLPILSKYYDWVEDNCKSPRENKLYTTTLKASVMENLPRKEIGKGAWIDFSAQQALAAQMVANIADVLGDKKTSDKYWAKYQDIFDAINKNCWDKDDQFFYDLKEDGTLLKTKHIGAFWTILSECYSSDKLPGFLSNLKNPYSFYRTHPFPTLAATDKQFSKNGHYWNSGVWSETNFMVLLSLSKLGEYEMAYQAASAHLSAVSDVFYSNSISEKHIAPSQRLGDSYHTSWEAYSSEKLEPARGIDSSFFCR